jgi:hypothetical protein
LKQNEIHLNNNKVTFNDSILAEKANKNLKNYSENSVFDFSLRKENLSSNQFHLENKLEAAEKKENKENLSMKNSNSVLNNVYKNAISDEKNNSQASFIGSNIFTFRLKSEYLNNKQFHPSQNLIEAEENKNSLEKEEQKVISKRNSDEKATEEFDFEMIHEHLSKRQFDPVLNNIRESNDPQETFPQSKQPINAENMRKDPQNFDFHLNHESLNKKQFHPQLRVNVEETLYSKKNENFDFHFNHESLSNKQFHPQIKVNSNDIDLRTQASLVEDSIKIENKNNENNFDFHFNHESLNNKQFHPQLRIVSEAAKQEKETVNVIDEANKKEILFRIDESFDFHFNNQHLNKEQFHPSLRVNKEESLFQNVNEKNESIDNKIQNIDFHFNNEHLNKKQFHPSLRIENEAISFEEKYKIIDNKIQNFDFHFNNQHLNKKQFHPSLRIENEAISFNEKKKNIDNKTESFDFHFNKQHLNKKQFHPSLRNENEAIQNNQKDTKLTNSLISINSSKIENPKTKEESFFDFHLRKETLKKELYHPSAIEAQTTDKITKLERELIIETPIIKTIKSRVESQNFDFHLNHENLNKNQFHPYIESKSEGKKDIKKIKEFFDFHFRKESINKALFHPENLSDEKIIAEKEAKAKAKSPQILIVNRVNETTNSENKFDFELIHEKLNNKQFHPQVINFAKEQLIEKANRSNKDEIIALAEENKNKLNFDFRREELDQADFHPTVDQISIVSNTKDESLRTSNDFDFHFNRASLNNKQFHPAIYRVSTEEKKIENESKSKVEKENTKQKINFDFEFRKESLNEKQYHPAIDKISEVFVVYKNKDNSDNAINLDFSFRKEKLDQKEFHPSLKKEEVYIKEKIIAEIKKEEVKVEEIKGKKANLRGAKENKTPKEEKTETKIIKDANKNNDLKINFDLNEVEFSKEQIMKNPQFLKTFFGVDSINKKPRI